LIGDTPSLPAMTEVCRPPVDMSVSTD